MRVSSWRGRDGTYSPSTANTRSRRRGANINTNSSDSSSAEHSFEAVSFVSDDFDLEYLRTERKKRAKRGTLAARRRALEQEDDDIDDEQGEEDDELDPEGEEDLENLHPITTAAAAPVQVHQVDEEEEDDDDYGDDDDEENRKRQKEEKFQEQLKRRYNRLINSANFHVKKRNHETAKSKFRAALGVAVEMGARCDELRRTISKLEQEYPSQKKEEQKSSPLAAAIETPLAPRPKASKLRKLAAFTIKKIQNENVENEAGWASPLSAPPPPPPAVPAPAPIEPARSALEMYRAFYRWELQQESGPKKKVMSEVQLLRETELSFKRMVAHKRQRFEEAAAVDATRFQRNQAADDVTLFSSWRTTRLK